MFSIQFLTKFTMRDDFSECWMPLTFVEEQTSSAMLGSTEMKEKYWIDWRQIRVNCIVVLEVKLS